MSEAERLELEEAMRQAFASVRLGNGVSLQQARAKDDYQGEKEQMAARSLDREERWEEVADVKLTNLHDVHAFLDADGFRFYLPAYMQWVLRHLGDEEEGLNCSFLYSLMLPPPEEEWYGDRLLKFEILTVEQAKLVAGFWRFLGRTENYRGDAEEALRGYWGKF
jgi:hypothetical protein